MLASDITLRRRGQCGINDLEARYTNYVRPDADWVPFEAVLSTAPDQIAIGPGELVREWTEGGRRKMR